MEAYVATLMASRDGPYGSGLLKSIVLEFSGFDRALAEELSRLKDEQLLALHEEWPERAAPAIGAADWLHGSADVMKNTIVVSARHLVGQVRGGRADAEGAKAILANLMWKAQLRSLFPWIEEIRPAILAPVEHLLQPIIATPGVLRERPGADPEPYTWDSLELGDALRLGGVYKIKWPRDSFNRMRRTKWVRDDLAHRRPASVASLDQMFGAVSDLI